MKCRICPNYVTSDDNLHWTHEHGDVHCGTGDGSTAYPLVEPIEASGADINAMVEGYLDAQLWAGLDYREEGSEPVHYDENYSREDIAEDYVAAVRAELTEVVAQHPLAVRMYLNAREYDPGQGTVSAYFGHDFYLTREYHGAGFWDCGLGELGDYLTKVADSYGAATELWDNGNGTLVAA
uniref:C2H2-type domain-containing protein n=1 Tax=Mycobacterium Phage BigBubba TaxID=3158890 RepID=A0AAU8GP46_9CAUD